MSEQIREAMRWLLLPVPVEGEEAAVAAAAHQLRFVGVEPEDAPTWVELELASWRESGEPSGDLAAVVGAYVEAGDPDLGPLLAHTYFTIHQRLAARPMGDHDLASAVLSHARLMVLLARDERLSAAQVAKLVSARDRRVRIDWHEVEVVLKALRLAPRPSVGEMQALHAADEQVEVEIFADADEATCAGMVAAVGQRLGFPGDLLGPLEVLLPTDRTPFGPHLQILHYQCMIAEFYDHALSAIYEFSPRGVKAKWLFDRYPPKLEVAQDPFLNNAKGVGDLSLEWARSKKAAHVRGAHALVAVIEGLDSLGFSARRELAAWLRRLLVRRIRLARGQEVELPERLSARQATALFRTIAAGETGTRGILEQRVVDAVASLRHPPPSWLARGLLDPVNATNVSRRKCGDCDFQNAAEASVVAYEAHAGRLTDLYVRGHLRTLDAVLVHRVHEWEENVGPGLDWHVTVRFVAHDIDVSTLPETEVHGIPVRVEATDYETFLAGLTGSSRGAADAVDRYVRAPIAAPRTPDSIRSAFLDVAGVGA